MTDDKQLDHLIAILYETVLNPSLWQDALKLCLQYVGGGLDCQMLILDKNTYESMAAITAIDKQRGDEYINYYIAIDPRAKLIEGAIGEWQCCHHAYDRKFVSNSEFYQDFLIPNGGRYNMAARIDENERQITVIGMLRALDQSPYDGNNIQAAKRFEGHLQRTLRLQSYTQNLRTKAELGAIAIDALAMCMLIVDANQRILHLNHEAERMLAGTSSGLTGISSRLSAKDPANRNQLSTLVTGATSYPPIGGAMFLQGDTSRQVFVVPLPASSPFVRDWQVPLALVWLVESGKNLPPLTLIGKLYDLSPAELRVASALLAGKSPEEHAQDAGISINTVRTQLKNLFSKTGTRRQAELVVVLSRVPPMRN